MNTVIPDAITQALARIAALENAKPTWVMFEHVLKRLDDLEAQVRELQRPRGPQFPERAHQAQVDALRHPPNDNAPNCCTDWNEPGHVEH